MRFLHFKSEGETKVKPMEVGCHSQENTHSPSALEELTNLWAPRRGGLSLNASEIKLSSLAIFKPPWFIFLAAVWEGWEGEKGMKENGW